MAQPIWETLAGDLGVASSGTFVSFDVIATPVYPATLVTYTLISGELPNGLILTSEGSIEGTPTFVSNTTVYNFTVRATDNLNKIKDRSFFLTITGAQPPSFVLDSGPLLTTLDSIWVEYQVPFINQDPSNIVKVGILNSNLPPGLEINENGLIRGYPNPTKSTVVQPSVVVTIASTSATTNLLTVNSTNSSTVNFYSGRPITFSSSFGNIVAGTIYYIKRIPNQFTFSVCKNLFDVIYDGPEVDMTNLILGAVSGNCVSLGLDTPIFQTYNFNVVLYSDKGNVVREYSITVINHELVNPPNTRVPVILNTKPLTFNIDENNNFYPFYREIGIVQSGSQFFYKIIGYDFDDDPIGYNFLSLPLNLIGDNTTGWVTGNPTLSSKDISEYFIRVRVYKLSNPSIFTDETFPLIVSKNVDPTINWVTNSNLGILSNGDLSHLFVEATCSETIEYRIVEGELPKNLTLLPTGELAGRVSFQPTDQLLEKGDSATFTFKVEAYSPLYQLVKSVKEFSLVVKIDYEYPYETVYFQGYLSITDRQKIELLLQNETIIPTNILYRPTDKYFGKATNILYPLDFGLYGSSINKYFQALVANFYDKQITLGPIKVAQATNISGEPIYEVVYSEIVDDLENSEGVSVPKSILWPVTIDLKLGPWYADSTIFYTSYENIEGKEFYTSLDTGRVQAVYPNSLNNMVDRLDDSIGHYISSNVLPLWMTSQQKDGNTLGLVKAWVICYTKPNYGDTVKNNINTLWPYKLNQINFKVDRLIVDKSMTYNYNDTLIVPTWNQLPGASPTPDPIDKENFYVLFPNKTILPKQKY